MHYLEIMNFVTKTTYLSLLKPKITNLSLLMHQECKKIVWSNYKEK